MNSSPLVRELAEIAEGRRALPDSGAKRHHLVPEFLLRRFASVPESTERIKQLDVRSGANLWADPRTAASRRRFYQLPDDEGGQHNQFESYLSVVESHTAPAIARMVENHALTSADRATIAFFLAMLQGRTLGGLARLETLAETTSQSLLLGHLEDRVAFREGYIELFGPADEDTIEQFRESTIAAFVEGRVRIDNPRAMALDLLQNLVGESFQIVFQLQWELLVSEEAAFVTSDNGMAMHDPTPRYPFSGHAWLSSPNAETIFPVDPHHCLRLSIGPLGPSRRFDVSILDEDGVDRLNLWTYGFAEQYIFGDSQEAVTRVRHLARKRPRDVLHPRPNRSVMIVDADPADHRLAREHAARGWPPQLVIDGTPHDYVVLDPGDKPLERSVELSRLSRERAVRRLGTEELREQTVAIEPWRIN